MTLRGPPRDHFDQIATYLHTPWLKTLCLDKLKPTIGFEKKITCLGIMSSAREYESRLWFGKKLSSGGPLNIWTWPRYSQARPAHHSLSLYIGSFGRDIEMDAHTDTQTISKLLHPPLTRGVKNYTKSNLAFFDLMLHQRVWSNHSRTAGFIPIV